MSDKSDRIVEQAHAMIREITDPVELQRQLREMLVEEFPRPAPFVDGECLLLSTFLNRFKKYFARGVEPTFYQWPVFVVVDESGLSVRFAKTEINARASAATASAYSRPLTPAATNFGSLAEAVFTPESETRPTENQ